MSIFIIVTRKRIFKITMENLEIVFKNIIANEMSHFLLKVLNIDEKNIISSHFWDSENCLDLSFQQVSNIDRYFTNGGNANIYFRYIILESKIEDVLVVISNDGRTCDVTLNFCTNPNLYWEKLFVKLWEIVTNVCVEMIILGFEPAEDTDMKILEIQKESFILYETYWDDNLIIPSNIYTCVKRMIRENKISINVHST